MWTEWPTPHGPFTCVKTCCRGFLGFIRVQTSASAHVLHLPTNSVRVFQGGSNLWSWVNSNSSLHTEEQGDEARESSAFGVGFQVGTKRARFLGIVVTHASQDSR